MNARRLRKRFYRKSGGPRAIGLRCKVYCAGCIVCDSYRFLDERGRFPYTFDEAAEFSDACVRAEAEAERAAQEFFALPAEEP